MGRIDMGKKRTIWILNHYASFMDVRHISLAEEFVKAGYNCVIVASSFHHGFRKYLYEEEYTAEKREDGIDFIYLRTTPSYQNNGARRVFNMFSYNRMVHKYSSKIADEYGRPIYIIASSLHPLVWEIGHKLAKKYTAKWVAEVKDLWPQQLIKVGGLSKFHPSVVFFSIVERRAYERANAVVVSMPHADKYICGELGVDKKKVHWMANGIMVRNVDMFLNDESIVVDRDLETYLNENWCCVYCGSLVENECVPFIVSSFKYLTDYPQIKLAIIGDGHSVTKVKKTIDEFKLGEQVRMFPRVNSNVIPKILSKAQCCVAALKDNPLYEYGLSICKLNDYLYSGKPTIFACGVKNVVQDAGGISIPFGDAELLAHRIYDVYTMAPSQIDKIRKTEVKEIKDNYDYSAIGKKYLNLLHSL